MFDNLRVMVYDEQELWFSYGKNAENFMLSSTVDLTVQQKIVDAISDALIQAKAELSKRVEAALLQYLNSPAVIMKE